MLSHFGYLTLGTAFQEILIYSYWNYMSIQDKLELKICIICIEKHSKADKISIYCHFIASLLLVLLVIDHVFTKHYL